MTIRGRKPAPEPTRTFRHAGRAITATLTDMLRTAPLGHIVWLLDEDAVVPIRTHDGRLNQARLTDRDRMYLRRAGVA